MDDIASLSVVILLLVLGAMLDCLKVVAADYFVAVVLFMK